MFLTDGSMFNAVCSCCFADGTPEHCNKDRNIHCDGAPQTHAKRKTKWPYNKVEILYINLTVLRIVKTL